MARVVVIGKNQLAVGCLDSVLRAGDDVVLAVADAGDDGTDGWQPSFRAAAERANLRVLAPERVNAAHFVAVVEDANPDFVLSFQAAQILGRRLIASARVATLNLHFGPLPRYRGVAPIAWAMINGEDATGVTIHRIDPGVDSGDLIASREVRIHDHDTGRTLYDRCTNVGIELFAEWWPELRTGRIRSRPQDDAMALYYNRHSLDFSQRRVTWRADARAIANWIRAFIFPPFQYPVIALGTTEHEVAYVRWDREPTRARPGEVLEVGDETVIVAAPGGRVLLGIRADSGEILGHHDLLKLGLEPGAQLALT